MPNLLGLNGMEEKILFSIFFYPITEAFLKLLFVIRGLTKTICYIEHSYLLTISCIEGCLCSSEVKVGVGPLKQSYLKEQID